MDRFEETTYGERIAEIYDTWYGGVSDDCLGILTELADGGRALELGIGTGRVALPLKERGIEVHGIDASPAMLAKLRSKSGGGDIPVTVGDFANIGVAGEFSLIYVLFNTFFGILTQEKQVLCFANVAQHLSEDGVFLLEAFVPDMTRFVAGQSLRVINVGERELRLDASRHDPVHQQVTSQHIMLTEEGARLYPVKLRYAWPSELDLMARLADLSLRHRWTGWEHAPFTSTSTTHISVYKKKR